MDEFERLLEEDKVKLRAQGAGTTPPAASPVQEETPPVAEPAVDPNAMPDDIAALVDMAEDTGTVVAEEVTPVPSDDIPEDIAALVDMSEDVPATSTQELDESGLPQKYIYDPSFVPSEDEGGIISQIFGGDEESAPVILNPDYIPAFTEMIIRENDLDPEEMIGGRKAREIIETVVKNSVENPDMTGWLGFAQSPLFGFGDEIIAGARNIGDLEGYRNDQAALEYAERVQQMTDPTSYLSGTLIGAVAGPGMGAVKLAKEGSRLSTKLGLGVAGATGSKAIGTAARVAGQGLSYSLPSAALATLDATGRGEDKTTAALIGGAIGAILPGGAALTKAVGRWINSMAPTQQNAVMRAAKKLADQVKKPIDEVLTALHKERDVIDTFEKFGLNPEQTATAMSNAAFKAMGRTASNDLANQAGMSVTKTRDEAAKEISDYLEKIDTTSTAPAVGDTYRSFDAGGDALFDQFAEMTTGANKNTTMNILKEELASHVNNDYRTMLAGSGKTSIEPKDIFVTNEGVPLIASVDSKPLSEEAFKKLSKKKKATVITIDGKRYLEEDLFPLDKVDGTVLQTIDQRLNSMAGRMINDGETVKGMQVSRINKDLSDSQNAADPNLALAKALDSQNRGQGNVTSAFTAFAGKGSKKVTDFNALQEAINKEIPDGANSIALKKEAIKASIQDITSSGREVKGLMNPDGSINSEFRKFFLNNGFTADELDTITKESKRLAYLESLAMKPELGKIEDSAVQKFAVNAGQRMFLNEPVRAGINALIITVLSAGRRIPGLRQILDAYGVKQADVISKIASLDKAKLDEVLKLIDKPEKPVMGQFLTRMLDILYKTGRTTGIDEEE